jgi:hypothetical protein
MRKMTIPRRTRTRNIEERKKVSMIVVPLCVVMNYDAFWGRHVMLN